MTHKTRRHHIVPRFYLMRFANPKGQVFAYRRAEGRGFRTSVENVAVEAGFYSVLDESGEPSEIAEQSLAMIDGIAADAMKGIDSGAFPPSDRDRSTLAVFMAFQLTRTRDFRRLGEEVFDFVYRSRMELELRSVGRDELRKFLKDPSGEDPSGEDPTEEHLELVLNFKDRVEDYRIGPSKSWLVGQMGVAAIRIAPILLDMPWCLFTSEKHVFLTCDRPVAVWREPTAANRNVGLGVSNADAIFFPLDSAKALVLGRGIRPGTDRYPVASDVVRNINEIMVGSAYEWIFHHPNHYPLKGIQVPRERPILAVGDTVLSAQDSVWNHIRRRYLK